ncbi:hypothetical protein NOZE110980_09085 [Nocardioides zeicaulis]
MPGSGDGAGDGRQRDQHQVLAGDRLRGDGDPADRGAGRSRDVAGGDGDRHGVARAAGVVVDQVGAVGPGRGGGRRATGRGEGDDDARDRCARGVANRAADRLRHDGAHVEVGPGGGGAVVPAVRDGVLGRTHDGAGVGHVEPHHVARLGGHLAEGVRAVRSRARRAEHLAPRREERGGRLRGAARARQGHVGHRAADRTGATDEPGLVDREAGAAGEGQGEAGEPDVGLEPAAGAVGVGGRGVAGEGRRRGVPGGQVGSAGVVEGAGEPARDLADGHGGTLLVGRAHAHRVGVDVAQDEGPAGVGRRVVEGVRRRGRRGGHVGTRPEQEVGAAGTGAVLLPRWRAGPEDGGRAARDRGGRTGVGGDRGRGEAGGALQERGAVVVGRPGEGPPAGPAVGERVGGQAGRDQPEGRQRGPVRHRASGPA